MPQEQTSGSDDISDSACWTINADRMQMSDMQHSQAQLTRQGQTQELLALHAHLGVARRARKP